MIYLEMAGRLGNQMFRYSFARKLSLLSGKELIIDFDRVYKKDNYLNTNGWTNSLKLFKAKNNFKELNNSKGKIFFRNASFMQLYYYFYFKFFSKILKKNKKKLKEFQLKMQPKLNKYNLFFLELGFYNYDLSHLNSTKVVYVCGCFESSEYFNSIKNVVLEDFQSLKQLSKKNKELMSVIINSNSVCVTVRRGDFVTNKKNSKLYNICNKKYFDNAISKMISLVKNPVFIVFSDDVEWTKNNLDFKKCPVYYEDGDDTLEEKLRMMSSCKHFIISNSTFSWWAQYLSKNQQKIVISPNRWYKNAMESDLIEKEWLTINTEDGDNIE